MPKYISLHENNDGIKMHNIKFDKGDFLRQRPYKVENVWSQKLSRVVLRWATA